MVLSVGLVEALGMDEAQAVLLGGQLVQRGGAVGLRGHEGVIAVAHALLRLQPRHLLGHLRLVPLNQQRWEGRRSGNYLKSCFPKY